MSKRSDVERYYRNGSPGGVRLEGECGLWRNELVHGAMREELFLVYDERAELEAEVKRLRAGPTGARELSGLLRELRDLADHPETATSPSRAAGIRYCVKRLRETMAIVWPFRPRKYS